MSQLKMAWYWCALPLRMFLYFCAYIFGHPLPSAVVFAVVTAAALATQRPQLAGIGIAMLGLLLMWMAETQGGINTAWPARSPFAPPLPVEA